MLSKALLIPKALSDITFGTKSEELEPLGSASPTRSPTSGPGVDVGDDEDGHPTEGPSSTPTSATASGFFEDELRGYRLLKASKLSTSERQHILTLTKNSTHFQAIRRALRTLFSEEDTAMMVSNRQRTAWWNSYDDDGEFETWEPGYQEAYFQDYWQDSGWDDEWQTSYWAAEDEYGYDDWSPSHETYWEESTTSGYDDGTDEDMQNIMRTSRRSIMKPLHWRMSPIELFKKHVQRWQRLGQPGAISLLNPQPAKEFQERMRLGAPKGKVVTRV